MAVRKWCLDTYALVEIAMGDQSFKKYTEAEFVITDLTLAEFYGVLLREHNEKTANYWLEKFRDYCAVAGLDILIAAVKYRRQRRKDKVSLPDAVGYQYAQHHGLIFVTGDKEFAHVQGVEFKKAA